MEVGDVTQIRRNGNRSTENIVGSTNEIWPPPLVLTETFGSADNSLRQEAFEPSLGDDHSFWRAEQSARETERSSKSRRRLIVSTVIVAALAVGCVFLDGRRGENNRDTNS